ncbi:family 1 glycosylhydrolase [Nocardia sp. CS682]|uniref:family 1 glycosylhydrolase n=1 Tax=Nocardia sp. CS682 TaxID=1047172 RepID=UPI0010753EE0|nr:family 1 glycosylhydrolase [Nocardia sp. CS682]QBS39530.1 glycoside hydrolase family 1 [Nocardia sp. CS682]
MSRFTRRTAFGLAVAGLAGAVIGRSATAAGRPAPPIDLPPLGREFCWGVAGSGFQTEGHTPDSHQRRLFTEHTALARFPDCVDFYTRYTADIALAADLGVGVYGISIEWARLQPRPGEWDEAGFEFYDRVLDAMAANGIRPMLTLDHWVYPVWIAERGGWGDPGIVETWLDNARKVVDRYAPRDPLWITVANPGAYLKFESRDTLPATGISAMALRLADVHNAIYDYIHLAQPSAQVTMSINLAAGTIADATESLIVDKVIDRLDFVGLGTYLSFSLDTVPQLAEHTLLAPQDLNNPLTHAVQPESMYYALHYCAHRFPGKPVYVVENGMVTRNGLREDGYSRADHLRDTVYWLQRAHADGINVIGYTYWTLTDSFAWGSYALRFGLYTVDVVTDPTLTRKPTDAVAAYRAITASGGVPGDYRPTRPPAACSFVDLPDSCTDPVTVPR